MQCKHSSTWCLSFTFMCVIWSCSQLNRFIWFSSSSSLVFTYWSQLPLKQKIDLHGHPTGQHTDTDLVTAHHQRFQAKCSSYRVVFQLSLMQVDDVGAHTIQEVLRVRDEHEDSLEPDNKEQDERYINCLWTFIFIFIIYIFYLKVSKYGCELTN